MICKFCGTENVEDAIFCSSCGKRIDGKKECKRCENLISEQSVFCTYCGARCDEIALKRKKQRKKRVPSEDVHACERVEQEKSKYQKVLRVLIPSLCLAAIAVLLICSFFIGIKTVVSYAGITMKEESLSFFCFLGKNSKEISRMGLTHQQAKGFFVPSVTMTIVPCANLCLMISTLLYGAVKYGIATFTKKEAKLGRLAFLSFTSFLATSFLVMGYGAYYGEDNGVMTYSHLSDGGIAGIVIGFTLLLGAVVLSLTTKGKEFFTKRQIAKTVLATVCVAIVLAIVCVWNTQSFAVIGETGKEFFSPAQFMARVYPHVGKATGFGILSSFSSYLWITSVVGTVLLCYLMVSVVYKVISGKKISGGTLCISFFSVVASVLYLGVALLIEFAIFPRISKRVFVDFVFVGSPKTLYAPIVVTALSIALFAVVIATCIVNKKRNTGEKVNAL